MVRIRVIFAVRIGSSLIIAFCVNNNTISWWIKRCLWYHCRRIYCHWSKAWSTNLLGSLKFYPWVIISVRIFSESNIMKSTSVFNLNIISHYLNRVFCACWYLYVSNFSNWSEIIEKGHISTKSSPSLGPSICCPSSSFNSINIYFILIAPTYPTANLKIMIKKKLQYLIFERVCMLSFC